MIDPTSLLTSTLTLTLTTTASAVAAVDWAGPGEAGVVAEVAAWLTPTLTTLYLGVVALVAVYGLHRYWLVFLHQSSHRRTPRAASRYPGHDLPRVTVQLPLYNEGAVAQRIIDAACAIEYPRDRLQIQVCDDSTDASRDLVARRVAYWREQGVDIDHLHRTDRVGYKAGALQHALPPCTGEFVAIFDSDFVPPRDVLHRTVHHFLDPAVGLVQTRWEHLNREGSVLTRCQAFLLDGHFAVEHAGRNRSRRWIHFNGTAGLWRRATIDDAGGWSADTLSEDLDLSIRAQLRGWRFVYLNDVACPAELPPTVSAYKLQQHRWNKGTTQAARKLLWPVLRSDADWRVKSEALFQFTWPLASVAITLSALLYFPAFFLDVHPAAGSPKAIWGRLPLSEFLLVTGILSGAAFYAVAQRAIGRSPLAALIHVPALMIVGTGIALTNTRAVFEAMLSNRPSEFVRTPKYGDRPTHTSAPEAVAPLDAASPRPRRGPGRWLVEHLPHLEILAGLYMLLCLAVSFTSDQTIISAPLLAFFAWGYLWFGIASWREAAALRRST